MLRLIVLAASLLCVLGAPRVLQRPSYPVVGEGRIVGGAEVAIEEVPYQLSIKEFSRYICGASIISADWAVTAARCVEGSQPNNVNLFSGSSVLIDGVNHLASDIIINDQYDSFTIDFDVAVIRVSTPFEFDATTAIIALATTAPAAGTPAIISGWGTTSAGSIVLSSNLRRVEVPIYDQEACNVTYAEYGGVTDQMICAGLEEGGGDFCQVDYGGPLTANGVLVGIASWHVGCAQAGHPGVYSNVAALNQWIVDNTR